VAFFTEHSHFAVDVWSWVFPTSLFPATRRQFARYRIQDPGLALQIQSKSVYNALTISLSAWLFLDRLLVVPVTNGSRIRA
jgi:hypothetical protein